jgi:hypothetical protein
VDRVNLSVQMQVGALSERVTVTAEQPLLQTETAVRSRYHRDEADRRISSDLGP